MTADNELEIELVERALRNLVLRYRDDAKRQSDRIVREALENHAAECERLAEQLRRFRDQLSG